MALNSRLANEGVGDMPLRFFLNGCKGVCNRPLRLQRIRKTFKLSPVNQLVTIRFTSIA